jgi:hypothetical protein
MNFRIPPQLPTDLAQKDVEELAAIACDWVVAIVVI